LEARTFSTGALRPPRIGRENIGRATATFVPAQSVEALALISVVP
jgi:hypothetical protein